MSISALWMCLALEAAPEPVYRPRDSTGYLKSAIAQYESLNYELALSHVNKARLRAVNPEEDAVASLAEGVIWADWGRPEKARIAFERGFQFDAGASLPVDASPKIQALAERSRAEVNRRAASGKFAAGSTFKPKPCGEAERAATSVWNDETQARLVQTLRDSSSSKVKAMEEGLLKRLNAWCDSWIDQHLSVCLQRELKASARTEYERQLRCLARQGHSFNTLVRSVRSSSALGSSFGNQLPEPSACLQDAKETAEESLAATPARAELDFALAKIDLGQLDEAEKHLENATRLSKGVPSPLLHAEVLSSEAKLSFSRQDWTRAQGAFRIAIAAAMKADAPHLALELWTSLIEIQSMYLRRFGDAAKSMQSATRLLTRVGSSRLLQARLKATWAGSLLESGKPTESMQALKQAAALIKKLPSDVEVRRVNAKILQQQGSTHYALANRSKTNAEEEKHNQQAIECFEKSIQETLAHFGNSAPELIGARSNLAAMALVTTSDLKKPEALLLDAVALSKVLNGVSDDFAICNLGQVYLLQDRLELAEQTLADCIEKTEKIHGPEHRKLALDLELMGVAYRRLKQPEKAVSFHRRQLAIGEQLKREGHSDGPATISEALVYLGLDYAALEDWPKLGPSLAVCRKAIKDDQSYPDIALSCELMIHQWEWANGDKKSAMKGMQRLLKPRPDEGKGLVARNCENVRLEAKTWLATHRLE